MSEIQDLALKSLYGSKRGGETNGELGLHSAFLPPSIMMKKIYCNKVRIKFYKYKRILDFASTL